MTFPTMSTIGFKFHARQDIAKENVDSGNAK